MGGRSYIAPFAQQLADVGLLVFSADYRDIFASGGGFPAAFGDISCAVQFARTESTRYRGDGGPVTLVGHSLGAWVGSVAALDSTPIKGDCLADGSGRPDSFVGLAGDYKLDAPANQNDMIGFFGGPPATTASSRASSDPFKYATGSKVPVRLLAGTADTTVDPSASTALAAFLKQKGWDVKLTLVPGATHTSLIDATADGPESVQQILEATRAARLH
jgi:acetyl esterase/lipase